MRASPTQSGSLTLEANGRRSSALTQGEGPVVLLVHGFPDHNATFRHQLPALAEAGYRDVAPTLFRSATAIAIPPLDALEAGIRKHPVQIRNSWYTLFFQLRGLSEAVVRARNFAFNEKLWRDWSPG